jgi:predicted signal transduction protein with EAL and GGDEF domain
MSVNLSVREFAQPDLVKAVASILEETGLPPQALRIEITESAIIGQKHPAIETVEQLRALGVAIHLDDFGTGYSALSYLHRLPLDAVKVDRAFTSSIDQEERPLHVVRAIISLAHAIGLAAEHGLRPGARVHLLPALRHRGVGEAAGHRAALVAQRAKTGPQHDGAAVRGKPDESRLSARVTRPVVGRLWQ